MTTEPIQLDLLEWQPISNIVVLPAKRWGPAIWKHRVPRVAEVLRNRKSEAARARYWGEAIDAISSKLANLGASQSETAEQIQSFYDAVDREMARQRERTA